MARTVRNPKIDTRTARAKLPIRPEPFWTNISRGCAIGYRRGKTGGSWVARFRSEGGKQYYEALGAADDARDADGQTVFNYSQAQERARAFFNRKPKELTDDFVDASGPYTVANALEAYFADRDRRGSKGVGSDRSAANVRILPQLGDVEIRRLTTKKLRSWLAELAVAPKHGRPGRLSEKRKLQPLDMGDPEAVRARRATANRTLTILKAALNHAFNEGHVLSDEVWRKVKPYREVDAPKIRFLSEDECRRLVNACPPDFRSIVRGALLTGCRYGELCRMRVSDFTAQSGTVTVRLAKSGIGRHVVLTTEGQQLFTELAAGRGANELIFIRTDKKPWSRSQQQRPLENASEQAKIEPAVTFHILRHTYASTLAMRGTPMGVIASQLGHQDTRMTEKHYAHLAPSYVADTIRAAFPTLGIVDATNVVPIGAGKNSYGHT